jgi:anti-sigma B factor antagonist
MSCLLEQTGLARYRVTGELCVQHVTDLLPHWLALGAGAPVSVDLKDVAEIDTAGVQLLLVLKRLAPTAVSFRNPSSAVTEAFGLIGLTAVLGATAEQAPQGTV